MSENIDSGAQTGTSISTLQELPQSPNNMNNTPDVVTRSGLLVHGTRRRMFWFPTPRSSTTDRDTRGGSLFSRLSIFNVSRFSSVRESRDWAAAPVSSTNLKDMDEKEMAEMMNNNPKKGFSATVYAPEERPSHLDPLGDQEEYYRLKKLESLRRRDLEEQEKKDKRRQKLLMIFPCLMICNSTGPRRTVPPHLPVQDSVNPTLIERI